MGGREGRRGVSGWEGGKERVGEWMGGREGDGG